MSTGGGGGANGRGRGAQNGGQEQAPSTSKGNGDAGIDEAKGSSEVPKPGNGKGGQLDGAQGGTAVDPPGTTGETALITEVTSLLRSLRAPPAEDGLCEEG